MRSFTDQHEIVGVTRAAERLGVGRARATGLTPFFGAAGLSLLGDWLTTVALVVVLFRLTGSAAGPAGYVFVRVAPRLAGPWWGGALADRFSPRLTMTAAAAMQGFAIASLPMFAKAGSVPAILVVVALAQFLGAVGRPSQLAVLPSLVTPSALPRANAFYGFLVNGSIFVGPAVGGLLLARFGPTPLFLIDAATFLVASAVFYRLPRRAPAAVGSLPPRWRLWQALSIPAVRTVAAANFASGVAVTSTQAVLIVAAHQRYAGDASVGFLYASVGLGGTLGALVALRWLPQARWTRLAIFVAAVVEACMLGGFAGPVTAAVGLALLVVGSGSSSLFDAWGPTEVQRSATAEVMGRYSSIIFLAQYGGMVLGASWALASAAALGWERTVEFACVAALGVLAAAWIFPGRAEHPSDAKQTVRAT